MFSSTHFDIRLSLQSFQVYKKPSNWNGEQFNAEQRKTYSLKIWFQKETVGRPSQILWDTPTWQFCSPQAIAYQNQFFETKNRIHMNPYISAKRRWPGDFFNFGCHITSPLVISGEAMTNFNSRHVFVERYHWSSAVRHSSHHCIWSRSWRWWQQMVTLDEEENFSDMLGIWCIICVWDVDYLVKMMSVSEWWGSQICWCSKLCCQIWRPYVILWFPIPCSNTLTSSENLGHGISYLFSIPIAHLLVPTADASRQGVWFLMGHVGH